MVLFLLAKQSLAIAPLSLPYDTARIDLRSVTTWTRSKGWIIYGSVVPRSDPAQVPILQIKSTQYPSCTSLAISMMWTMLSMRISLRMLRKRPAVSAPSFLNGLWLSLTRSFWTASSLPWWMRHIPSRHEMVITGVNLTNEGVFLCQISYVKFNPGE